MLLVALSLSSRLPTDCNFSTFFSRLLPSIPSLPARHLWQTDLPCLPYGYLKKQKPTSHWVPDRSSLGLGRADDLSRLASPSLGHRRTPQDLHIESCWHSSHDTHAAVKTPLPIRSSLHLPAFSWIKLSLSPRLLRILCFCFCSSLNESPTFVYLDCNYDFVTVDSTLSTACTLRKPTLVCCLLLACSLACLPYCFMLRCCRIHSTNTQEQLALFVLVLFIPNYLTDILSISLALTLPPTLCRAVTIRPLLIIS